MKIRLLTRRSVVWPTPAGWLCLLLLPALVALAWAQWAEAFLSVNEPMPAEALIVEAWTGREGAAAAAAEFRQHPEHYRYLVVVGGMTGHPWTTRRWSWVDMAQAELVQAGIDPAQIIAVHVDDVDSQRTFATAVAARQALEARELHPSQVNVLTLGAHARRSRLVFARVFADSAVGVLAWCPEGYTRGPWWRSSERTLTLLKESLGYTYERLLSSGRGGGSTA